MTFFGMRYIYLRAKDYLNLTGSALYILKKSNEIEADVKLLRKVICDRVYIAAFDELEWKQSAKSTAITLNFMRHSNAAN